MATKQKLTLYFPPELLEEARLEAERQERTVSWILQKAWEFARHEIHKMPGADDSFGVDEGKLNHVRTIAS